MTTLPLSLALAISCAFLPAANAGSIIVSRVASGDLDPGPTYDLDTYGSTDWVLYSTSVGDIGKSGGTAISALATSFTRISSTSSYDPSFSWTGGDPTATASNSAQNFAKSPDNNTVVDVMSLTATATTSLQTLYLFAGVGRAAATLDLSFGDASATPVADIYNIGDDFAHVVYKIDYFADSDTTLNVSWSKTAHLGGAVNSHIRFQGAALTVPEPSSALLSATALGLLALRRKR